MKTLISAVLYFRSKGEIPPGGSEMIVAKVPSRCIAKEFMVGPRGRDLDFRLTQGSITMSGMVHRTDISGGKTWYLNEGEIELHVHNPTNQPAWGHASLVYLAKGPEVPDGSFPELDDGN